MASGGSVGGLSPAVIGAIALVRVMAASHRRRR